MRLIEFTHAKEVMVRANAGDYLWGTNWIKKLRFAHLAKYGDDITQITKDLDILQGAGKVTLKNGKVVNSLEEYAFHNMDIMGNALMKLPLRKRDILYMVLFQGGPLFVEQAIRKFPVGFGRAFGAVTDGITG